MSIFHCFRDIITYFPKFKEVTWPEHILFRDNLQSMHLYSSVSISTQPLECLASPIPNIWLTATIYKNVTLTIPVSEYFDISRLTLDIFCRHTKFGDSCFSRSKDIIAGIKIDNGLHDPDHALLGVVYYPKLRTWYSLPMCKIWRL